MPICRTCTTYYTKHAMVCPRCHNDRGLVRTVQVPGDTVTLDGERFFILDTKRAPTGEPLALVEPVDGGESEWVYADNWVSASQ